MSRTDVRGLLRLAPMAIVIGVGCALVLIVVSKLSAWLQDFLWTWLPERLSVDPDRPWWIVAILTVTGLVVRRHHHR